MIIRIVKKDLDALKIKAIEEGLPYQTLVSSIIHKFLPRIRDRAIQERDTERYAPQNSKSNKRNEKGSCQNSVIEKLLRSRHVPVPALYSNPFSHPLPMRL